MIYQFSFRVSIFVLRSNDSVFLFVFIISSITVSTLYKLFSGLDTTSTELSVVESIFKLGEQGQPSSISNQLRDTLIDSML